LIAAALPSRPFGFSEVTEELIGEAARVREREEMATWKLVDGDLDALPCDATLELDRKEPIVASANHMDGYRGPRLKSAGLAEHDIGLGALLRFSSFHDLRRKVVQEVGGEIKARAVATAVGRGYPRFALPPTRCWPTTPPPSRRARGSWR
jgi:hypothetical protein